MAKDVVMPALGMTQETGTLLRWLKAPGDTVTKGEPLMEVETDKATVEIEAPGSGILTSVTAKAGDVIPVGQRIALILAPGETAPVRTETTTISAAPPPASTSANVSQPAPQPVIVAVTPIAARLAAEHNLDLTRVRSQGGQIRKEDVLAYLAFQKKPLVRGRVPASPKAKRLAQEGGLDLKTIPGSGPEGAVVAADVLGVQPIRSTVAASIEHEPESESLAVSRVWRVMVERLSQAWTTIPHFYLIREVNATGLIAWREKAQNDAAGKITYTDLLVKLVAVCLRRHVRLNASWQKQNIILNPDINIGLAVAVEDGLVVPVIHRADGLELDELARRREEIVAKAQAGKLSLDDISGGTFTISNLGMYGVDAFNAIVNPPQAAILAVGRIADRVVPLDGQPAVQPMITFSLSCDHRVVDGVRGAQFLQSLAELVEDPEQLTN